MKKKLLSILLIFAILFLMFSANVFADEMSDGTYEVTIALWHSQDDKESMAADSVGETATIVVANGVKTMHITSGEMSMMGIKASLQELRIADENGDFVDAKVESKNAEGDPTGFYFTMPHTNEYITVKVNPHIAIMDNKDIGARIKVDYSTLKLVSPAQSTAETKAETTVILSEKSGEETLASQSSLSQENVTIAESEIVFEKSTSEKAENENTTAFVQTEAEKRTDLTLPVSAAIIIFIIVLLVVKIKLKKQKIK